MNYSRPYRSRPLKTQRKLSGPLLKDQSKLIFKSLDSRYLSNINELESEEECDEGTHETTTIVSYGNSDVSSSRNASEGISQEERERKLATVRQPEKLWDNQNEQFQATRNKQTYKMEHLPKEKQTNNVVDAQDVDKTTIVKKYLPKTETDVSITDSIATGDSTENGAALIEMENVIGPISPDEGGHKYHNEHDGDDHSDSNTGNHKRSLETPNQKLTREISEVSVVPDLVPIDTYRKRPQAKDPRKLSITKKNDCHQLAQDSFDYSKKRYSTSSRNGSIASTGNNSNFSPKSYVTGHMTGLQLPHFDTGSRRLSVSSRRPSYNLSPEVHSRRHSVLLQQQRRLSRTSRRYSTVDRDSSDEDDNEETASPRFCATLSAEAQFAMLKGYEDVLLSNLRNTYPEYKNLLQRTKTPANVNQIMIDIAPGKNGKPDVLTKHQRPISRTLVKSVDNAPTNKTEATPVGENDIIIDDALLRTFVTPELKSNTTSDALVEVRATNTPKLPGIYVEPAPNKTADATPIANPLGSDTDRSLSPKLMHFSSNSNNSLSATDQSIFTTSMANIHTSPSQSTKSRKRHRNKDSSTVVQMSNKFQNAMNLLDNLKHSQGLPVTCSAPERIHNIEPVKYYDKWGRRWTKSFKIQ
ncbi:unnamed protein product [Owenia fusiformis]|uniref:Uncharacterized protein n=1 Tax=Owenia fusiformis TaxID=6347 RepID=A0A8J1XKR3_OWEFU|nr:unnamed protein product [Owenia fusiformis]